MAEEEAVTAARSAKGRVAYEAGRSAEDAVARIYAARGMPVRETRWRGTRGEIDLIVDDGDGLVFVEVKHSVDFDRALGHVTPAQIGRLYATAEEYLGQMPRGSLTDVRFDVALVDGRGVVRLMENAFGHV